MQRFIDELKSLIAVWDAENENASPVLRDDVIDSYFVQILRSVPEDERGHFSNEFVRMSNEDLF